MPTNNPTQPDQSVAEQQIRKILNSLDIGTDISNPKIGVKVFVSGKDEAVDKLKALLLDARISLLERLITAGYQHHNRDMELQNTMEMLLLDAKADLINQKNQIKEQ